jgi:hypothetical protein
MDAPRHQRPPLPKGDQVILDRIGRANSDGLPMASKELRDYLHLPNQVEGWPRLMADAYEERWGTTPLEQAPFIGRYAAAACLLGEHAPAMIERCTERLTKEWHATGKPLSLLLFSGLAEAVTTHGTPAQTMTAIDAMRSYGDRWSSVTATTDVALLVYQGIQRQCERHRELIPRHLAAAQSHGGDQPPYTPGQWLISRLRFEIKEHAPCGEWWATAFATGVEPPHRDTSSPPAPVSERMPMTESPQVRAMGLLAWCERQEQCDPAVIRRNEPVMTALVSVGLTGIMPHADVPCWPEERHRLTEVLARVTR